MKRTTLFGAACTAMLVSAAQSQVIYDNTQPPQAGDSNFLLTDPAGGCAGLDLSAAQFVDGLAIWGYGVQGGDPPGTGVGNHMSDQMEICTAASVTKIRLFGYQTGATATSLTGASLVLWLDGPSDCGVPVYDSTVTPATVTIGQTTIYRADTTTPMGCDRRIQFVDLEFSPALELDPGVYWLDWSLTGDAAFSGPWAPALANIAGLGTSGDAWQFTGSWAQATDGAADEFFTGQPFIVEGTGGDCSPGEQVPPANDDMANPAPLTCQYGSQVFFLERATGDGPGASCDGGGGDCYGDITGDAPNTPPNGAVDVNDLLGVIGAWGPCDGGVPGCYGDITGDAPNTPPNGAVDVNDLLGVIGAWGPCPPGPAVASPNLWYDYTAAASESLRIVTSDGSGIAVYDGAGDEIACGFGEVEIDVTMGASYLVEVFAATPAPGDGAVLSISVVPTGNDLCEFPEVILSGLTPFSTVGATTSGPVHAECQYDGNTYADRWFVYTATDTGLLTVSTCEDGAGGGPGGSADFDTDLVVYANTDCSNLELLACNDDANAAYPICGGDPGWHSVVENIPVIANQEYLIRVGGWGSDADQGTGELFIGLVPGAINAICQGADLIAIDQMVSSDTTGAPFDAQAGVCDVIPTTGGLWYSVIGDGNTLTATTCLVGSAGYDTIITVYCGDCTGLFCVGSNDNDTVCVIGNFEGESTFSWCSDAGQEYLVFVHGASAQGTFSLQVTSDLSPCADPPICGAPPCAMPPGTPVVEGEPCLVDDDVDNTNGGCNSDPDVFGTELVINGAPVSGTVSTYQIAGVDNRDTDWYLVTHAGGLLTMALESEFPGVGFMISGVPGCAAPVVEGDIVFSSGPGDLQCVSNNLPAGTYAIFVSVGTSTGGGVYTGYPCSGGENDYTIGVTSP